MKTEYDEYLITVKTTTIDHEKALCPYCSRAASGICEDHDEESEQQTTTTPENHIMSALKVILKTEPKRNGGGVIAFFPDRSANYGQISYLGSCYGGAVGEFKNLAHGECPLEYYYECKPYKGNLAQFALDKIAAMPEPCEVVRVYRQTQADRKAAWNWRKG